MAQIDKTKIIQIISKESPKAKLSDIVIYADAYIEYQQAQSNIAEHGSIVFHPKTGAPIDNPYIKIRNNASAIIRKMPMIKADSLWKD